MEPTWRVDLNKLFAPEMKCPTGHGLSHRGLHHEQGGEDCHTGNYPIVHQMWDFYIWTFQNVVGGRQPKLIQLQTEESDEEVEEDEGEVTLNPKNAAQREI